MYKHFLLNAWMQAKIDLYQFKTQDFWEKKTNL